MFDRFLLLLILVLAFPAWSQPEDSGIAVVELFTSQGCSSCPSADALLASWQKRGEQSVFMLSFHVDYWNYLGWADPFSQKAFSVRQRAYARKLGKDVYTPQMIVNGQWVFVGSNHKKAKDAIELALKNATKVHIDLSLASQDQKELVISFKLKGKWPNDAVIHLALVEDDHLTPIRRGENSGKKLANTAVVRQLVSVKAKLQGRVSLKMPLPILAGRTRIVAWLQAGNFGPISGASSLIL